MIQNIQLITLPVLGDERGSLIALEGESKLIPFEVKRVYYIFGTTPHTTRGKHAHYKLQQLLVCTSGSCDILLDNGTEKQVIKLDSPTKGLLITHGPLIWREMSNFSKDCVLMVLASAHYDETDYIRNYEDFLKEAHNR